MKLGGLLTSGSYTDNTQSREALKCLSNCILLRDNTKEFIVEHDGVAACFHLLESSALSTESQFLTCRILFFMTVNNSDIVQQLIRLNIQQVLQNVRKPTKPIIIMIVSLFVSPALHSSPLSL